MNKPESVKENEMHTIPRDFEIQSNHRIPSRRPDQVLINKKKRTCHQMDFTVITVLRFKIKENEEIEKYFAREREREGGRERET